MKNFFFYLCEPSNQVLFYTPSGFFIRALKIIDIYIPGSNAIVKGIQNIGNLHEMRESTIEERFLFLHPYIKDSNSWQQFLPRFNNLLEVIAIIEKQLEGGKNLHPLILRYFYEGKWNPDFANVLFEITDDFPISREFLDSLKNYDYGLIGLMISILGDRRNFYREVSKL